MYLRGHRHSKAIFCSMCRTRPTSGDLLGTTLGMPSEAFLHLRNYIAAMLQVQLFVSKISNMRA